MSKQTKALLTILGLILVTTAALATMRSRNPTATIPSTSSGDRVAISMEAVQDKVLQGGDGKVTVALDLRAPHLVASDTDQPVVADLVIVLDRSGSMQGGKLNDAKQAVIRLLDRLGTDDRLALITYSDRVQTRSELVPIDAANRRRLITEIDTIRAGGGTNLGGGLQRGIDLLTLSPASERQRKIILISDGLANQGITDPTALSRMASAAVENRFSVSTVGVGLDFNEVLMTAIADHGAGSYHFLEDPQAFAGVFEEELQASRRVAASDVEIRIPLAPGVQLLDAGGYPIHDQVQTASIRPGNLRSGQNKRLYLTYRVPTVEEKTIRLDGVQVRYRVDGRQETVEASVPLSIACVPDPTAVMASIKKEAWADQVVEEEFNRLKEAVAADIRDGDKDRAQRRIRDYEARQTAINTAVGSGKVAENLETDVQALRERVDETFAGAPAAVAEKKKQVSKALQYDSYQMRRDKKK